MKKADLDALLNKVTEMNLAELSEFTNAIDERRTVVEEETRKNVDEQIRTTIQKAGFNPDEYLSGRTGGPRTPKFRDPKNPQNVWGGRGKKPAWLQKALEGASDPTKALEQFRVVQNTTSKAA